MRIRLAALMFVVQFVILGGSVAVLAYAGLMDERDLAIGGAFGLLAGILMILLWWLLASRANCPLCMMPVMVNKRCAKHGKARTVLGSHRLRVALSILFRNAFNCPYCMESTAVRVRSRREIPRRRNTGRGRR
jgi:hypothetical protein